MHLAGAGRGLHGQRHPLSLSLSLSLSHTHTHTHTYTHTRTKAEPVEDFTDSVICDGAYLRTLRELIHVLCAYLRTLRDLYTYSASRVPYNWKSRSRTSRTASSATVLIYVPSRLLTSPDSVWNRVRSGADVRMVDRPLRPFLRRYDIAAVPTGTFVLNPY
jgi:hypothetical protein